jgi:hypothetical protein
MLIAPEADTAHEFQMLDEVLREWDLDVPAAGVGFGWAVGWSGGEEGGGGGWGFDPVEEVDREIAGVTGESTLPL